MGKSNTVALNGKQITVRELTMQEINDLTNQAEDTTALEQITGLLSTCTNTSPDDIMVCYPSDLEPLVDELVKVNSSFLDQATALNSKEVADALVELLKSVCLLAFLK